MSLKSTLTLLFWVILFSVTSLCSLAFAALTISLPAADGDTISGTYTFTAATPPVGTVSVEFRLPSYLLCVAKTSPYTCGWNTGFGQDGSYALQAIARDALGVTLSTADRIFHVKNGTLDFSVTAPDITVLLSGTVNFQATASDSALYPFGFHLLIDGVYTSYCDTGAVTLLHTQVCTLPVDTTVFTNGTHELTIVLTEWTDLSHIALTSFSGQITQPITLANGTASQEIFTNTFQVPLNPGATFQLTCTRRWTDATTSTCTSPSYVSDTPSVVTVSAGGLITAVASGFAAVTVTAHSKTTQAYVRVQANANIPHLSGAGALLTAYDPATSFFPVAPFNLDPYYLQTDANLLAESRRAGINTVSFNMQYNPRSTTISYADWKVLQDSLYTSKMVWSRDNGFHMGLVADDVVRRPGDDMWWCLNWPQCQQATTYAMQTFAGTGMGAFLDVTDESSLIYTLPIRPSKVGSLGLPGVGFDGFTQIACSGMTCTVTWPIVAPLLPNGLAFAFQGSLHSQLNTPLGTTVPISNITATTFDFTPNASITGTFNAGNDPNLELLYFAPITCSGVACNPFIRNDAVPLYASWLAAASPHTAYSWPPLGITSTVQQGLWMGSDAVSRGISTHASHFWDSLSPVRTYSWGDGVQQRTLYMIYDFLQRQPYMDLTKPQLMLTCRSGEFYYKHTAGAYYTPPVDTLLLPGCDGPTAVAESLTAVALGNAGLRQYYFDPFTPAQRDALFPLGSLMATGMRPDATGRIAKELWEANGYISELLTQVLRPYVLGTALAAPVYARNILAAVRQGSDAKMLLIVNDNDAARTLVVDFTPYKSGTSIYRYLVSYNGLQTDMLPDATSEALTLSRGQAVVYLFPFSSATFPLRATYIAPTFPPGAVHAAVAYNYLYAAHIDQSTRGTDCTLPCILYVDPRITPIYYQITFTDGTGALVSRTTTAPLPMVNPPDPLPTLIIGNEVITTPLPDPKVGAFKQDGQNFWKNELPRVLGRYFPSDWVYSGGLHAPAATCTSIAFSVDAFVAGPPADHVGAKSDGSGGSVAINYAGVGANCANPGSATARVAACSLSGNSFGNWHRASGSNYFVNFAETTPVIPLGCAALMDVVITNGAITNVGNIARHAPVPNPSSVVGGLGKNVRECGALVDGVADDTVALNNCLATYSHVFVPAGVLKHSGTIVLNIGNWLDGVWMDPDAAMRTDAVSALVVRGSALHYIGTGVAVEAVAGGVPQRDAGMRISNLLIYSGTGTIGIHIKDYFDFWLDHVNCQGQTFPATTKGFSTACLFLEQTLVGSAVGVGHITDSLFRYTTGYGIKVGGGNVLNAVSIAGTRVQGNDLGGLWVGGQAFGWDIGSSDFEGNGGNQVFASYPSGWNMHGLYLEATAGNTNPVVRVWRAVGLTMSGTSLFGSPSGGTTECLIHLGQTSTGLVARGITLSNLSFTNATNALCPEFVQGITVRENTSFFNVSREIRALDTDVIEGLSWKGMTRDTVSPASVIESTPTIAGMDTTIHGIVNTVTETTLYSTVIPGKTLQGSSNMAGALAVNVHGSVTNTSAGTVDLTVRVKYGGVTLSVLRWQAIAINGAPRAFTFRGHITGSMGFPGNQGCAIEAYLGAGDTVKNSVIDDPGVRRASVCYAGTAGANMALDQTLLVTAQFSVADPAINITRESAYVMRFPY